MYREIEVGGITIPMLANGATPLRYKLIFRKDIISEFQLAENDYSKVTNSIPELAFIMSMQAKAKEGDIDLDLLNMEKYLEWLEQFEPLDLTMAADKILDLYTGNNETTSESKKKVSVKRSEH